MKRTATILLLFASPLLAQPNDFQMVHQDLDTTVQAVGRGELTQQSIIALARADAKQYHKGLAWGAGGGLLGAAAMLGGGVAGVFLFRFPGSFFVGTGVGAIIVPGMVSLAPVTVPASETLTEASPAQQELYGRTYIYESRKLRKSSVVKTELVYGALLAGLVVLVLLSGPPFG